MKKRGVYEANNTQDGKIYAQDLDKQTEMLMKKKKKQEEGEEAVSNKVRISSTLYASPLRENKKNSVKQSKEKKVTFSDQQDIQFDGGGCRKFDSRVPKGEVDMERDRSEEVEKKAARGKVKDDQYVWKVRFSPEEDEALKKAVFDYIKMHGWNEHEGLEKVLNCSRHKEAWHCWVDIQRSLPHRPRKSVRHRAHVLLEEGTHLGHWSRDERENLLKLHEAYGHDWRKISTLLGRGRINVREKWRTFKRPKMKGGWTQAELQKLSELVHRCLWIKAKLGGRRKEDDHRMIRDDVNWEQIAYKIRTHGHGSCCGQWYYTLTSSMVASGEWADGDDRLLLQRLLESGACAVEEVDWDLLLDHRSGQTCMRRWQQMVKHLGEYQSRQFLEKLELLTKRYAPDLLGRTEYDNDETQLQASPREEEQ